MLTNKSKQNTKTLVFPCNTVAVYNELWIIMTFHLRNL